MVFQFAGRSHSHGTEAGQFGIPIAPTSLSQIGSESRFAALYKTESRITGSPSLLVSDYIQQQLLVNPWAANLAAQIAALKLLVKASTAELERLFAEHVDTSSYRYDAWLLGLVNQHISTLQAAAVSSQKPSGIYLGAYAWVEELRPSTDPITLAQLPPDLAAQFPGTMPLLADADNGGYIHAPSIPHADAAAVLRAGFEAGSVRRLRHRSTLRQPFLRPRARSHVTDRGNTKWPQPRRVARLPVRVDSARRLHDGRDGPVHLPIAQSVSPGCGCHGFHQDCARRSH